MKKCNRLISHLAFLIDYSIISINRPTTNANNHIHVIKALRGEQTLMGKNDRHNLI